MGCRCCMGRLFDCSHSPLSAFLARRFPQAVIVADGSASNLGVITSVNATAVKLFGHSRWQLEHRNLSTLMPSPFAELHDSYMRRYLVTGTSTIVDYTRVLFGLHRNGTIFTVRGRNTMRLPYPWKAAPIFVPPRRSSSLCARLRPEMARYLSSG